VNIGSDGIGKGSDVLPNERLHWLFKSSNAWCGENLFQKILCLGIHRHIGKIGTVEKRNTES